MNLLKKADDQRKRDFEIKESEADAQIIEENRKIREHKRWFNGIAKQLWPSLRSINQKRGFVLQQPKTERHGELIEIWRHDEYLGTVCIGWHSYQFRGSDESPEQTCQEECIWFTRVPYLKEYQAQVNHFSEREPQKFLDRLVFFISKHLTTHGNQ